jgi:hypothetical protein
MAPFWIVVFFLLIQNLGTASEAQAIAHGVSRQTLRMWLKRR